MMSAIQTISAFHRRIRFLGSSPLRLISEELIVRFVMDGSEIAGVDLGREEQRGPALPSTERVTKSWQAREKRVPFRIEADETYNAYFLRVSLRSL